MKLQLTILALATFINHSARAELCGSSFSSFSAEMNWRSNSTQPSQAGSIAPSSVAREAEMQAEQKLMENEILGIGFHADTPPLRFYPSSTVKSKHLVVSDGLHGVVSRIQIGGTGVAAGTKSVSILGTLLLPVSGHTGPANAKVWSKSDTYTIRLDTSADSKGTFLSHYYTETSNAQTTLIRNAKSLDLVTNQEVEVNLVRDRVMRIIYFRSGSGGPSGYFEGRVFELVWDGT